MSSRPTEPPATRKHVPYVPETMEMKEFTLRAILLGLFMTVVLGAANAYLGLRAGITIAATYPAAVIAMAAMRAWKGSLLEENIARTAGSIGESVAAGAIFTIPAFLAREGVAIVRPGRCLLEIHCTDYGGQHSWACFSSRWCAESWWKIRSCPFPNRWRHRRFTRPDSAARKRRSICSGISASAASFTCWDRFGLFAADTDIHVGVGSLGRSQVRLGAAGSTHVLPPAEPPCLLRPA